ncbi:MAG TPA: disulfide bond formation protein B [Rhizobiales bacterium]|nr:disulfide bond formation protein B [bacterium BMS3Bbin10]HDO52215.1 disulfide bond formation protein B [Hyphomicrobiales bacterium]
MSSLQRITLPVAAAVTAISALVTVLAALAFEHLGGYTPCALCLIERYAYYAGVPLAGIAFFLARAERSGPAALLLALCGLGFLINAGIGVYHSGIEWKWWPGPEACSAGALAPLSGNLLEALETARAVSCSDAPWRLLGLSFAGWSAVISLGLAMLSFLGVRNARA